MSTNRFVRAKEWMTEHDITYRALGEQLGVSIGGARAFLARDTIPTGRHAQLVELGFPEDILPTPMDLPPGPKPKVPHFPGLAGA